MGVVDYRWIVELDPADPEINMDRDTALLDEMREPGTETMPAIRIYRWAGPAVSIGRLQNTHEVRAEYPDLPIVRRPTGGRAVHHGDDLTVTVATRTEWIPGADASVMSSYQVIAGAVADALRSSGIDAMLGQARKARRTGIDRSVDCFAAVASCDIAEPRTGAKLAGCAQRRDRGAILQQMSIRGNVVALASSVESLVANLQAEFQASLRVRRWISLT